MARTVAKTFRASDRGLGKVLGHLEEDVMDSLWARKEATGKEVLQELSGKRKVAYTTVLTVLDRLHKKGLVKKVRGKSGLLFSPAYTKAAFSAIVSREVMRGVIEMSQGLASAGFVNVLAENDPKELDRLSKLIEEKKRELKEK